MSAHGEHSAGRRRAAGADSTVSPDPVSPASIPDAAVTRLATYQHVLRSFSERGVLVASSNELATAAGVNSAILRKDLSHVGANGVRGVGYDVSRLTARIKLALRTDHTQLVALAGAGRLGTALAAHTGFGRGFEIVALFDADPALIGTTPQAGGPQVEALDAIERTCAAHPDGDVAIGVIATEESHAQAACDAFVAAGIRQLLNVTTVGLSTSPDVVVRNVDLALELQVLGFQASRSRMLPTQSNEPVMGEETVTA